jgi:hypothetical protein
MLIRSISARLIEVLLADTRRSHHGHQDDRRAHHRQRFGVDRDKFSVVAPTDERYGIGAR